MNNTLPTFERTHLERLKLAADILLSEHEAISDPLEADRLPRPGRACPAPAWPGGAVTAVPAPTAHGAAVNAEDELFGAENLRELRLALDVIAGRGDAR